MLHTLDFYMLTHASAVTFPFLSSLSEPVFTSLKSFPTSGPPFLSHMVFHFSRFVFLIFFFFFILSFLPPTLSFHPHCSQPPWNFLSHNFTPNSLSLFIPVVPFSRCPVFPLLSVSVLSYFFPVGCMCASMCACVWQSVNMDDEFF